MERDNFTCQYCGNTAPDVKLEVDHIHPLSKGGKEESTNLITACKGCNASKSNRILKMIKTPERIQLPRNTKESYKGRCVRLAEETWELMKKDRWEKKLSWNKYILFLIEEDEKKQRI